MSFSRTGKLNIPRYKHTATLLDDGCVLVAGGYDQRPYVMPGNLFAEQRMISQEQPFRTSRAGMGLASPTAEFYDPATSRWVPVRDMATGRMCHTATLLQNGRVLVVGGSQKDGYPSFATAELFDPETHTWLPAAPMSTPRSYHSATLLADGRVLVAGGFNRPFLHDSAELYDPQTDTWSSAGTMVSARRFHIAIRLLSGEVLLVAGGSRNRTKPLDSTEVYDPIRNRFRRTGKIQQRTGSLDGCLLTIGEVLIIDFGRAKQAERFDSIVGHWIAAGVFEEVHPTTLCSLLGGRAVGFGLYKSTEHFGAIVFDPCTSTWTVEAVRMPVRIQHTATTLQDGRVLIVGGYPSQEGITALLWQG